MKSKDLTIDVTSFHIIKELRNRNAEIDEVLSVVKQCYCPHYKAVTFVYQGSRYFIEKGVVYLQTSVPMYDLKNY